MVDLIVAGIDTGVGKTVVSSILTTLLKGDYWKPIQSGEIESDTQVVSQLLPTSSQVHPPAYSLKAPLSPHAAAKRENRTIDSNKIVPPKTSRPLIVEMAGGVLVPLNDTLLSIELFQSFKAPFILVSKNYLGSINHTLLTIETLQRKGVSLLGLIFNGEPNIESERAILSFSNAPFLGRLLPEKTINQSTIQRYANTWQLSGTLLLK